MTGIRLTGPASNDMIGSEVAYDTAAEGVAVKLAEPGDEVIGTIGRMTFDFVNGVTTVVVRAPAP